MMKRAGDDILMSRQFGSRTRRNDVWLEENIKWREEKGVGHCSWRGSSRSAALSTTNSRLFSLANLLADEQAYRARR